MHFQCTFLFFTPGPARNSFQASPSTSLVNNNDNINSIRRQMGWSQPLLAQPSSSSALAQPFADSSEIRELKTKIDLQNLVQMGCFVSVSLSFVFVCLCLSFSGCLPFCFLFLCFLFLSVSLCCVRVHACMCVSVCVYVSPCVHASVCVCVCVCMRACVCKHL